MQEFIEIPASKRSLNSRKPIYGVGINDADYMVCPRVDGKSLTCLYYRTWKNMLVRAYDKKYQEKYPTYKGCSVAKEWLTFSNFRAWMEVKDWKGKQLDKDILVPENKEYGPNACIFVSGPINMLLADCVVRRGCFPRGVSWDKPCKKYQTYCSVNGKNKHLGYHSTVLKAEYAYLTFKSSLIKQAAYEPEAASNPKLQAALLRHSGLFADKANGLKDLS